MMKARVDKDLCIGCGLCADLEPSIFKIEEDGLAVSYNEPTPEEEENVRQAIESCPVEAISEE